FVPATPKAKEVLDSVLPRVSTVVTGTKSLVRGGTRVRPQRIGVYRPWMPSMDEGWTRLVLEKFEFPYVTLHDAAIRAGQLGQRIDVLLIPSIEPKTLREGYGRDQTEPAYVGGLGVQGTEAIRRFVGEGGKLVCLEDSCPFAIETLHLPVRNVVAG